VQGLKNVKKIIAVASGKGGVGKSTISVNLALALSKQGASVGLLDADIYGPSQPAMLGTAEIKPVIKDRTIQPIIRHGLQTISIGNLVDANAALAWRGPMLGKALEQLMYDTAWQNLDYLVVDLPPGTGDVQLSLCQKIPVSGAVIVTTPQDLALHDVRRACEMFRKLNVSILGIVENMSTYQCSHCGHEQAIFGQGGGEKLASEYDLSLLAAIPLDIRMREMTDNGNPPLVQAPESHYSSLFLELADKLKKQLALQPKDYSSLFPKIVVEK
jgi:ATP-binding protein involved in chromosome partitioning